VNSRFTSTGRNETACQAARGCSFAAGTTDGPGDFDFTQSSNSTNIFGNLFHHFYQNQLWNKKHVKHLKLFYLMLTL